MHRPWGNYQSLDNGDRDQVERIVVKKGGRLSLQYHNHRSEHWVVVRGTAKVTLGDQVKMLQENKSTYIPAGTPHRLENPGKIDLELIEVQTGSYLGEDDIIPHRRRLPAFVIRDILTGGGIGHSVESAPVLRSALQTASQSRHRA